MFGKVLLKNWIWILLWLPSSQSLGFLARQNSKHICEGGSRLVQMRLEELPKLEGDILWSVDSKLKTKKKVKWEFIPLNFLIINSIWPAFSNYCVMICLLVDSTAGQNKLFSSFFSRHVVTTYENKQKYH